MRLVPRRQLRFASPAAGYCASSAKGVGLENPFLIPSIWVLDADSQVPQEIESDCKTRQSLGYLGSRLQAGAPPGCVSGRYGRQARAGRPVRKTLAHSWQLRGLLALDRFLTRLSRISNLPWPKRVQTVRRRAPARSSRHTPGMGAGVAPSSDSAGASRHDCKGTRPWNLPRQLTRDFDHNGVWLELKSSGTADLLGPASAGYLPMSCSTVSVRSDQPVVVAR
jgi:hypothetical protein